MKRSYTHAKKSAKKSLAKSNTCDSISSEYKESVRISSYIGKKGYTIPKSIIEEGDMDFMKKDLFMTPQQQYGIKSGVGDSLSFPVWRENENKIYIPRFYGIMRYGLPEKSEIDFGDSIDIRFTKELRDYQENIIKIYLNYVLSSSPLGLGGGAILEVPCGRGKTVMALKIIAELSKKTLILVHKEFLMNQWIERIDEFLPSARIGKIQGSVFDIEGKDIVIGMIQTMYSRDFPVNTFTSFGLTIIDEVHRIGSEEFSKTLLKTITPYMLGISATVERKDGLTRILNMFIGEKIYSEERSGDDPVCVRGIEYISTDNEFNETDVDWKGDPKYSTMISKICSFGPRSDFIIRVVKDLILENPENQIMILAHNRSLLKYLYESIEHHNITSVGYYVGGMKEHLLKETEGKQIVLATYAMAAEALDIKTLSTLIMVTPKTDIEQSVGRILRTRHENPIVVDIIDKHDTFQNQWRKRKTFYRKCNYRIISTDSLKYNGMGSFDKWKLVFEPKTATQSSKLCKNNNSDDEETSDQDKAPPVKCFLKLPSVFQK
jgi:superfamily II DNA or RNA helicase